MIDYLERALAAEADGMLAAEADGVLPVANESGSAEWRGAAVGSAEPRERAAEAAAAPTPMPAAQTEAEGLSAERRMGEGVDWEEALSVWTGPRQEELVRAAARAGWPEQVRRGTAERVPWAEEAAAGGLGVRELCQALGRTQRAVRLAEASRGGTAAQTVPVPEGAEERRADWEELDRAVQRDARRYDNGFALY